MRNVNGSEISTLRPELQLPPKRPADFDPSRYPIVAYHWFGLVPTCDDIETPSHIRELRFQRNVERLHRLGPRVLGVPAAKDGAPFDDPIPWGAP